MRQASGHRDAIAAIRDDLERFRRTAQMDGMVMVNLASTESWAGDRELFGPVDAFGRGLDRDDERISPAMLYAYAAVSAGRPVANFTPSLPAFLRWPRPGSPRCRSLPQSASAARPTPCREGRYCCSH